MPPVQWAVNSYQSRALPLSAQRVVNYFAESAPPDAKSQVVMLNAPGIKAFGAGGLVGNVRPGGMEMMGGILYAVAGNTLYSIDSAGVATSLGTINTSVGPISMAVNRASNQQLAFVDGVDGWIYDTSGGLQEITDNDFESADTVAFQDGYFVFNQSGTSNFFISALDDGTSYSATDFANAEGNPDEVVAVFSNHRELWVFGEDTIEVYFNSGNADFPFERISGAYIERGCIAPHSIAADDNTLFWIADDRNVYRANGYTPQRVSTHAIEEDLRTMTDVSDAHGFFITISGHKFYHLIFPTGRKAYVLDVSTGLWSERESFGARYWRVSAYVRAYGKDIVGDAFQGRLGEMDMDTFQEFGGTMQGILTGPPVASDRNRLFFRRFEIDVESGVGLTSGQGSDPRIWLDWSDDGGRTFSLRKPFRSLGKIGEYQTRLRWLRMGQARNRVYRAVISDPVKRSIVAAHLDVEAGAH